MGDLSPRGALPVVLDLTGRLVVAVGGGPVSARRVHGFVDEGARVRVVAPWVCEDLRDLVRAGRVEWLERDYAGPADLDGAWLVHTATGERSIDREVADDAESQRTWCIDATDAATTTASTTARADVTTPAGRVTVATYAAGDPGLSVAVRDGVERALTSGALDLRRTRPAAGWVALVGGGPGSDGLLTARGHELLASADVVVVDRLAPRAVVDRLPASVRVIDVGKTPGHHPVPQSRINDILVEEAQRGLGVVRLKGGDPYVLGRGGEERLACEAHGIAVEVVPGVTSAVSVPAAAGIPVTHRGVARGFTVVTGHEDVPALPTGGDHTLVLLMGVTALARTTQLLVEHGRAPDCPVAVVERGFAPDQRTTVGTLETIAAVAAERGVRAPAVVVVGDVVRLGPDWTRD
ncbi:uroporphyrinogen-III C-methyltransferase [Terrabacter sp. NPDC000476]|uniref:uroporphyrinogen-III C-methyltransferase n=1 Tax=Terrabacter sp. NPDC000476 TaxID=3154258 RepID=UPI00331DDF68